MSPITTINFETFLMYWEGAGRNTRRNDRAATLSWAPVFTFPDTPPDGQPEQAGGSTMNAFGIPAAPVVLSCISWQADGCLESRIDPTRSAATDCYSGQARPVMVPRARAASAGAVPIAEVPEHAVVSM